MSKPEARELWRPIMTKRDRVSVGNLGVSAPFTALGEPRFHAPGRMGDDGMVQSLDFAAAPGRRNDRAGGCALAGPEPQVTVAGASR